MKNLQNLVPKKVTLHMSKVQRAIIAHQKFLDDLQRSKMSRSDNLQQYQALQSERQ
jgi:hypothetical protein